MVGEGSRCGNVGQCCSADIRTQTALLHQVVVAGIGTAKCVAAYGNGLAGTDVLVSELTAGDTGDKHVVAAQPSNGSAAIEDGGSAGVIHLVADSEPIDEQIGLVDGRGVRAASEGVIARQSSGAVTQRKAVEINAVAAHVFTGDGAAS